MTAKGAVWMLTAGLLALLTVGTIPSAATAQSLFDDFDRDEFVESDEEFIDQEDPFAEPREEDFTEGGKFVDEDTAIRRGEVTVSGRRTQLRLQSERELLPRNIAWGAGTGLLIGGWFALIENGTDRETQRSLGMGVVLGALLGMTVGLKTVIAPEAPRAAMIHPAERPSAEAASPALAAARVRSSPLQLRFALRF